MGNVQWGDDLVAELWGQCLREVETAAITTSRPGNKCPRGLSSLLHGQRRGRLDLASWSGPMQGPETHRQ